jgi:chitodextrinase
VAAHEIGHAVTEFTANLAYQRESGAMNEGFSDIYGAAVEHFAKGNGNDAAPDASIWLIGDEIDRRTGSAALRSMSNPTSLGQPDTYGGTNWVNVNCGTPTQNNDYCGVHTNSGVLNYWFYVLVAGASGTNDIGSNFNVAGIGMDKASNVAYRLESVYLSANSTFADARTSSIQSAIDLYGAGSAEEIAVTNAWHAVGVGSAYGGGGATYCASASSNVNDEYIGRVQLNTIDNVSGAQFYSDFTAITTDLSKNSQYTITVTPTWTGTVYSEGYAVWIDYNGDSDFDDAGELVFSQAATKTTPQSGSFIVPATATDGATRMRVSMKYNGVPTTCESFTYGEVEDYTINIGNSSGGDTEAPSAPSNLIASNVAETTATLSWTASSDNVGVTGYDVYQGTTNIGTVTGTTANITSLTVNTSYTFTVIAKDAAGNESIASNAVTFTTSSGADTQAPTAPSSLAASNVTQTTLDLNWSASTDNIGVTGYDIFQGSINIGTVTSTTSNITGLTANTAYSFYVVAKDAAGNTSSASNTVNATTLATTGGTSQVLFDGSFETGWQGWVDGGSDSYRYSGSRSYDGSYSIRLRDNSGTASSMTLGSFDVSSYDNIEVIFFFYANSMENGEDFWVRYYDGSSWITVASYARGTNFNNSTFYTATVNIPKSSYSFPANAQFRFQCDASANGDQVYIDKVKITATSSGGAFAPNSIADLGGFTNSFAGFDNSDNGLEIDGLQLSPNPASSQATLKVALDVESEDKIDVSVNIYNIQGRLIRSIKWDGINNEYFEKTIDVSQLSGGIYFVNITTSKGYTETQKLIVK